MKQNVMKYAQRVVLLFALYLSGPVFLLTSDPKHLALPLLILPFIWLFAVIVASGSLIYKYVLRKELTKKAQLNFGLVATVPVLLAVLQSIHQLSIKDIVLVLGLVGVASFYVSKLDLGAA